MNASSPPVACCLTPPGMGGIATIEIRGTHADRLLAPLLQPRSAAVGPGGSAMSAGFSLRGLVPDKVRLARLVWQGEVLDEVLVTARHDAEADWIVELHLHGGRRLVHRVLEALSAAGARIVASDARGVVWPTRHRIEDEAVAVLPDVATTAVAAWLLRAAEGLAGTVGAVLELLADGKVDAARERLEAVVAAGPRAQRLVRGVRVVLAGSPNAGKSTLANRLAGRPAALVSPQPGTTRDWLEIPGALDGIPCVWVDTAGLRETEDALERESIRRGLGQLGPADLVLEVIDASAAPDPNRLTVPREAEPGGGGARTEDSGGMQDRLLRARLLGGADRAPDTGETPVPHREQGTAGWRARTAAEPSGSARVPIVRVWNKADLPMHPAQAEMLRSAGKLGRAVSAATGQGLVDLRGTILAELGLADWLAGGWGPFTPALAGVFSDALRALRGEPPDVLAARVGLSDLIES